MTQSPFDVIKNQYTIDELNDIVEHGCASGCASNHIYYTDTVSFYDRYSDDICEYINNAIGFEFQRETFDNNEGNLTGYKNDIVWTFIELYAMELIDNINNEELEEEQEIVNNYRDYDVFKYNEDNNTRVVCVKDGKDITKDILSSEWGKSHIQIVNG